MTALSDRRVVRVLIVDDTPEIRELLRLSLGSDARFEVVGEACDGAEALELASAAPPDAVVLDLSMPVMDGLQVIPRLRALLPDVRILVLSGFDSDRMRGEALARGADAYVEKGAGMGRVGGTLAELCRVVGTEEPRSVPPSAPVGRPASGALTAAPMTPELDAAWGERMAVLAHELRTPLTVIMGFAATLRAMARRGRVEGFGDVAEAIERNAIILAELTRSLGDIGPADSGTVVLHRFPTDVGQLVGSTVNDLAVLLAMHPVTMDLASDVVVSADPLRIRQIVTNLLVNAARYSPEGAPITVTVARRAGRAVVGVRDHGPGVPAGMEESIFCKFVRLHEGSGGSGLGLHLSRLLAWAHGGDLTVTQPEGGGSLFELALEVS